MDYREKNSGLDLCVPSPDVFTAMTGGLFDVSRYSTGRSPGAIHVSSRPSMTFYLFLIIQSHSREATVMPRRRGVAASSIKKRKTEEFYIPDELARPFKV